MSTKLHARVRRLAARRKILAFGGLGALLGLTRQPEPAHAAHQTEDIGIGANNPTAGSLPTTETRLYTNVAVNGGFGVYQSENTLGAALTGSGGSNTVGESGGWGVVGFGGNLTGGSGAIRDAGVGVYGLGGFGSLRGKGGRGGYFLGGDSTSTPGSGMEGKGGQNDASALAVGGQGVVGRGGLGGNNVTRTGIGVLGQSTSAEGVRGESASGPGTLGVSSNGIGVYAVSHHGWGLYSQSPGYAGVFQGAVYIAGGLQLLGGFLTAVKHPDGSTRAAHGVTSAEPLIEDVGRARLTNGVAHVGLDPTFAALIQSGEYCVFPVPEGDCNGLFIAVRTATGFDVRELRGGTSTLEFSYRIVARRREDERGRLAKLETLYPLPAIEHTEVTEPHPRSRDGQKPAAPAPSPAAAPPQR
ncbi:MAG: hypothetical protein U0821_19355 [Chloroflexota bacterium]